MLFQEFQQVINISQQLMILQRETEHKRQREKQYRQQLYNTAKQQKMQKNRSRILESELPKQTFSLMKNIEDEQQKRKNKQKQYFMELQQQRLQKRQQKRKREEDQKLKQLELENKIKKEKELLQQKYNEQLRKQQNKKGMINQKIQQPNENSSKRQKIKTQKNDENGKLKSKFPQDSLDQVRDQISNQPTKIVINRQLSQLPSTFIYQSRFQNQQFHFPQRRLISNNCYRQLQMEKRKLEDQANSLRELNRYLGAEKTCSKKRTEGLQTLKELQQILDRQNANLQQQYTNKRQYYVNGHRTSTQNLMMGGYRNF